jgi:hypothetical protein
MAVGHYLLSVYAYQKGTFDKYHHARVAREEKCSMFKKTFAPRAPSYALGARNSNEFFAHAQPSTCTFAHAG